MESPLRPQSAHERNIIDDCDSQLIEVFSGRRLKEVVILRAQNVGLAYDRGLHHADIVYIADWRCHEWIQSHNFRGMA